MIEQDGWKLEGILRWVPVEPDEKITCKTCSGLGRRIHFGVSDDDTCQDCCGNGFRYTTNKRGEMPEVPQSLLVAMKDTFLDWEEKNERK